MTRRRNPLSRAAERELATYLFNRTWDLLVARGRSRDEDDEMVRTAHASRYHWAIVGRPRNHSIAEWQLSRVYAALGQGGPATQHGQRALEIAVRGRLAPFYVAYGHEALARAAAIVGDRSVRDAEIRKAARLVPRVRSAEARRLLEDDLATIR